MRCKELVASGLRIAGPNASVVWGSEEVESGLMVVCISFWAGAEEPSPTALFGGRVL